MIANMLVKHNIPLALAEELTPLFQSIFSDSDIAKKFSSRRTKTACIINEAVAPFHHQHLIQLMHSNPFAILIDGSSDTGIEEMNPMTVRIFDKSVQVNFLVMCMVSSCTAEGLFSAMEVFATNSLSWGNCVGLGVDNTSVNVGIPNSIKSRVLQKNPATYVMGCPCHIVHNTAGKAANAFEKVGSAFIAFLT